jgi:hypothetical protein
VNTEILTSLLLAGAAIDLMEGQYTTGAPVSGLAIFNLWLSCVAMIIGLAFAWLPKLQTLVLGYENRSDRPAGCCSWINGCAFRSCSRIVVIYVSIQLFTAYSSATNNLQWGTLSCSRELCYVDTNCEWTIGKDGIGQLTDDTACTQLFRLWTE